VGRLPFGFDQMAFVVAGHLVVSGAVVSDRFRHELVV
jgi:hypothetical protein